MSAETLVAVVDDDESFRTALVESLLSLGYDARGFACAEEFIAAADGAAWRGIITDIHMPGMSGFDLKRELAACGSQIPVIMITAHLEPDLESRAAASGAICLLRKPFRTEALLGCLGQALSG